MFRFDERSYFKHNALAPRLPQLIIFPPCDCRTSQVLQSEREPGRFLCYLLWSWFFFSPKPPGPPWLGSEACCRSSAHPFADSEFYLQSPRNPVRLSQSCHRWADVPYLHLYARKPNLRNRTWDHRADPVMVRFIFLTGIVTKSVIGMFLICGIGKSTLANKKITTYFSKCTTIWITQTGLAARCGEEPIHILTL